MIKPVRIYRNRINGIWRIEFERDGKLYWSSLRTRDEVKARRKWEEYVKSVRGPEHREE